MKKFLVIILCAIMILPTIPITVGAERGTRYGDYLYYEKYSNHIEITDCDQNAVSVDIPAAIDGLPVTRIGEYAFYFCDSLTSVTIPSNVIRIDEGAFNGCDSLKSVTIPSSVTRIGNKAFSQCGSLNISVDSGNKNYSDIDGVLFNKDKTEIIKYAKDKIQPEYSIPTGVTRIGYEAFTYCESLTNVKIPDSVTSIGTSSVFGLSAFVDTAYYNDDSNWQDGVLYIDNCLIGVDNVAFSFPYYEINNGTRVIADYAFEYCDNLARVTIPNSVTSIGDWAFSWCGSLTSITIPSSVTSIGEGVFKGCGILDISVDSSNKNYSGIDGVLFNKDKTEIITYSKDKIQHEYSIPDSVTSIGGIAFKGCDGLTSVTIPNSVISIGDGAFAQIEGLTSVTIGNSVKSIGDEAFAYCQNLTNVKIPDSVISIGDSAFEGCGGLLNITIPSSVTSIGQWAFGDTAYYNDDSNWQNGVLYIDNCLIEAKYNELSSDYTIENGTRVIADIAFADCDSLKSVTIPDSVISIGDWAFESCESLTSVAIPNRVTSIGEGAFASCGSLTSVKIPDSVTSIGEMAFESCYSLTSVTIPSSITSIGESAFDWCDSLTDVYYSGNEADWQRIDIGDYNDYLTGATIHYDSEIDIEPTKFAGIPTVSEENGVYTFAVSLRDIDKSYVMVAAVYNGKKLAGVKIINLSKGQTSAAAAVSAGQADTAKVFIWESIDSMKPLCNPQTVNIK